MKQLSFLDVSKDKKDWYALTPEYPKCYKTCAHFTNTFPDGSKDYYLSPRRAPRCCYHLLIKGYGTSGKDLKSKVINNIWHSWCVLYEPKETYETQETTN